MTPTPEIVTGAPQPVARLEWTEHVRQIDMPAQQKYCALVLATYADLDGSRVSPGVRRLAAVMDVTERAAVRSINGLQQLGLIRHEIGKAMYLMLSCNPTASEILWLDDWTYTTDHGLELIHLRSNFLSAPRVRSAYFGYATSQFTRLIERGRFAGSLETRREKHARHLMRLLWQGYQVYTTGHLPIRVEDPDRFHEFGRQVAEDPESDAARALLIEYEHKFDTARTVLPDQPDEAPLEDLLQRVRRAYLQENRRA
ncbi:DNA polymerase beta superfamily protein [Nocardia sp. NPDC004711]